MLPWQAAWEELSGSKLEIVLKPFNDLAPVIFNDLFTGTGASRTQRAQDGQGRRARPGTDLEDANRTLGRLRALRHERIDRTRHRVVEQQ